MNRSPIERLLEAVDRLNVDGATSMFASGCEFLTADGRRGEGIDAVRALLADFVSVLLSTTHRITAQWHQGEAWIAEVEATYELKDRMRTGALPRVVVLRNGQCGISELHVYGAHERPLSDHRSGEEGLWLDGRWMPPL